MRRDAQRHDEGGVAVREAADGDRRLDPGAKPDMPMPGREPVEGLEHRAIGDRLEAPPLGLDICQIAVNAEVKVVRRVAPGLAARCRCRKHHVRGRSRIPERR